MLRSDTKYIHYMRFHHADVATRYVPKALFKYENKQLQYWYEWSGQIIQTPVSTRNTVKYFQKKWTFSRSNREGLLQDCISFNKDN